jgi:predicted amidophosphoribosyltransferase
MKLVNENKCLHCGTPASPGAKYCESCGAPLPTAEPQTGAAAPPYQGVGIRFVATIIDLIVAGIIAGFVVLPL